MTLLRTKLPLLLVLLLGLGACQTLPVGETTRAPAADAGQTGLTLESLLASGEEQILLAYALESDKSWLDAAQAYQNLAKDSSQPRRSFFYIQTALMFYRAEQYRYIESFFDSLQEDDIQPEYLTNKSVLLAGSYYGIDKIYQSLATLPELEEINDVDFKILALRIRALGLLAIGKPMDSANLRMQISQYLNTIADLEGNHEFIWEALNRISERSVISSLAEPLTVEQRGWLELNLIARRSNMLPAKVEPWINQWYQLYGDHPAGAYFAINLLLESKRIYFKPTRIALMLPFSERLEKVSEAIQNGFLYAYYRDPEQKPDIEVINASTKPSEFLQQYREAIANGADFIVGPINKELISLLQNQPKIDVPTLALNYGDDREVANLDLYQFGLRPEDEAEQIANFALSEGRHFAITLVPDTEWGARVQRAFSTSFEKLGGRVVGSETYPSRQNDYTPSIKSLLNLVTSDQRHTIIQQVIGQSAKFDPRRRQDVDMVFIAANSRQARLIKPQLKFHRALDLPVYATSHIASSNANPDDDRDLNDILFVDIPWMLDNASNPDFQQITQLWPESSRNFSRLFALGLDAYRLIPSLRRLMINPGESEAFNTGELSVDKSGQVHRALLMATYENGVARLLKRPDPLEDSALTQ